MRSERERLLDIQDAIARIEKYSQRGKEAFLQDELIQNWMINQIATIGEACRALSDEFRSRHANVPWADIIAMRNIVITSLFWNRCGSSMVGSCQGYPLSKSECTFNPG